MSQILTEKASYYLTVEDIYWEDYFNPGDYFNILVEILVVVVVLIRYRKHIGDKLCFRDINILYESSGDIQFRTNIKTNFGTQFSRNVHFFPIVTGMSIPFTNGPSPLLR